MVFGSILAGSSPSSHQPGRRAGFLEDLNRPAEAVIGGDSYKIILTSKKFYVILYDSCKNVLELFYPYYSGLAPPKKRRRE
jgi:hypothetical protein